MPPVITAQPQSQSVVLSNAFAFSVTTTGTPPCNYQWYFNAAPLTDNGDLTGSQTSSLGITNVQSSAAGVYAVVISNAAGCVTSALATLTVLFPPSITAQPADQTVDVNTSVTLQVLAGGTPPLFYQWRKAGAPIADDGNLAGATTSVLTIASAQTNYAGPYDVVITNNYGAITSSVAILKVLREPALTLQPINQYILPGHNASFVVSTEGAGALSYQWFHDGVALANDGRVIGTTATALAITNVQAADVGQYWVVVSNVWGTLTSSVVTLTLSSTRYVNGGNSFPSAPYTNWATAAQTIQDAVDVGGPGDEIIVANGTYASGGRAVYGTMTNRVAVDRPMVVRSLNGPQATIIQGRSVSTFTSGDGAVRCAYLTNNASLIGFTLKSGGTMGSGEPFRGQSGGGVFCESVSAVLSNCIISGNLAAIEGGGAYGGTLNNCTLSGNVCTGPCGGEGGGAISSTLNNCIISGNWANWGGGVQYGTLNNCQITGNSAREFLKHSAAGGGAESCTLTNCTLLNNSAGFYGGGAAWSTLVGCLVAGNSAPQGGGASVSTVINCTVVGNSAPFASDGSCGFGGGLDSSSALNSIIVGNSAGWGGCNYDTSWTSLSYCCSPCATDAGSVQSDPTFVDAANGNYRLQTGSPCINAGTNSYTPTTVDLDGAPRVVAGVLDMGAFEHQQAPFLLVPPASQSVLIHSNVIFTVTVLGDGPLSYRWQKDGVDLADDGRITGSATASLSISSLVVGDAGGYQVIVTNALGTVTSAVATVTTLGLPSISASPSSRTVPAGTNINFSVTASGLGTLSYQWRFNMAAPSPWTNSVLFVNDAQSAQAGGYDVVVSNPYGAVTSALATLTVLPSAPWITTQPTSRVASVGQTIAFSVVARGTEPLSCQWHWNGSDIPGATGLTLTLSNLNSSVAGTYRPTITNTVGVVASTNVTLSVVPVIVWGMTNIAQLQGTDGVAAAIPAGATNVVAIAAGRTGYSLPCLALRADGNLVGWGYSSREPPIPPTATNVVAVAIGDTPGSLLDQGGVPCHSLALRADGTDVAWGSNRYGETNVPPGATNIVAIAAGTYHNLALRADGSLIAWGLGTDGQTNVPPNATNIVAIAAGSYHNLALRADGTVVGWGRNSNGQATNLNTATNIIAIAAGGVQSLALRADGALLGSMVTNITKGLTLGAPPPDATNLVAIAAGVQHSLGLKADGSVVGWGDNRYGQSTAPAFATNVLAISAGGYHSLALVRDPSVTTAPPALGRAPVNCAIVAGQTRVLNALALGGWPMRYQWYRDGTRLAGQTNQWLALANARPADTGNYQLVAMNVSGAVTSALATVSVTIPAPVLASARMVANAFSFSFTSIAGVIYIPEYKNGLAGSSWTELERRFGVGGLEVVTDASAPSTTRFYRVRALYAPAPTIGSFSANASAVSLGFATVSNAVYIIQYKTNLSDPAWLELSRQTGTGAPAVVSDPNPPGPSRFYRVQVK